MVRRGVTKVLRLTLPLMSERELLTGFLDWYRAVVENIGIVERLSSTGPLPKLLVRRAIFLGDNFAPIDEGESNDIAFRHYRD